MRRHLQRTHTQSTIDNEAKAPQGPFVAPKEYEITWDPGVVKSYLQAWEAKKYLKLKPEKLKWSPFLVTKAKKTEGAEGLQIENPQPPPTEQEIQEEVQTNDLLALSPEPDHDNEDVLPEFTPTNKVSKGKSRTSSISRPASRMRSTRSRSTQRGVDENEVSIPQVLEMKHVKTGSTASTDDGTKLKRSGVLTTYSGSAKKKRRVVESSSDADETRELQAALTRSRSASPYSSPVEANGYAHTNGTKQNGNVALDNTFTSPRPATTSLSMDKGVEGDKYDSDGTDADAEGEDEDAEGEEDPDVVLAL